MRQVIPQTHADYDETRIIERPDGFYWTTKDGERELGPFATLVEAVVEMESSDDEAFTPGESLAEAEDEIGIADWIDPDTHEPAEEGRARIDDSH